MDCLVSFPSCFPLFYRDESCTYVFEVDFHLDNSKAPNYQIINFHEILWRHSQCEILFHISRPALVKHKQVACLLCLYCSITLLVPNTRWWCRKWPMMYYLSFSAFFPWVCVILRKLIEKTTKCEVRCDQKCCKENAIIRCQDKCWDGTKYSYYVTCSS